MNTIMNNKTNIEYTNCINFIDNTINHISVKMLTKRCNTSPKMAKRILRNHPNTRLCSPYEFGSNKFVNYKLYKKITNNEIIELCNSELKGLLKNKIVKDENIKSYLNSGFSYRMLTKYSIILDKNSISKLSY